MEGRCLCGAVTVSAPARREMSACHCGMCRRWGGGPLLAVHCGGEVTVGPMDKVSVFRSSEWAERAFCSQCGTHLYYQLLPKGEYVVPAGVFDGNGKFELHLQIYVDRKPGNYAFANRTREMTEAEVLAMFG
ncbi:MAG: GFA family protein [Gammaproteobacteria bacterium]|nr:GFA family protein [Gammaproteobacteria bacterium]